MTFTKDSTDLPACDPSLANVYFARAKAAEAHVFELQAELEAMTRCAEERRERAKIAERHIADYEVRITDYHKTIGKVCGQRDTLQVELDKMKQEWIPFSSIEASRPYTELRLSLGRELDRTRKELADYKEVVTQRLQAAMGAQLPPEHLAVRLASSEAKAAKMRYHLECINTMVDPDPHGKSAFSGLQQRDIHSETDPALALDAGHGWVCSEDYQEALKERDILKEALTVALPDPKVSRKLLDEAVRLMADGCFVLCVSPKWAADLIGSFVQVTTKLTEVTAELDEARAGVAEAFDRRIAEADAKLTEIAVERDDFKDAMTMAQNAADRRGDKLAAVTAQLEQEKASHAKTMGMFNDLPDLEDMVLSLKAETVILRSVLEDLRLINNNAGPHYSWGQVTIDKVNEALLLPLSSKLYSRLESLDALIYTVKHTSAELRHAYRAYGLNWGPIDPNLISRAIQILETALVGLD